MQVRELDIVDRSVRETGGFADEREAGYRWGRRRAVAVERRGGREGGVGEEDGFAVGVVT